MKKIWEVTINNWSWDSPKTKYYASRKEAEEAAKRYPASDGVKYSGNFTDESANILLDSTSAAESIWEF